MKNKLLIWIIPILLFSSIAFAGITEGNITNLQESYQRGEKINGTMKLTY